MDLEELMNVITYWTQGEFNTFIEVWLLAYASLCYCYLAGKFLPKGVPRLAAFLPVVGLFLFLPLKLHTMHLGGTTAFFLVWLANFKLILFAFHKGPLSNPKITLPRFVAIACLPIKLQQQNPDPESGEIEKLRPNSGAIKLQQQNSNPKPHENVKLRPNSGHKSLMNYAIKVILLALTIKIYSYENYVHRRIIMMLYYLHMYLGLEIMLAVSAAMARGLLGLELEPQFNAPYLSSSLQDFWGRRWNLMVTGILRPSVYLPVLKWSVNIVGRKWAPLPAVMSTFVVSGVMHELLFYYLGRVEPTWEITWFFLLHGTCLMVEIVAKKWIDGRWRLPRFVGTFLTVGLVSVTGFGLFFPQLLRCNGVGRALDEMNAVGAFAKDMVRALGLTGKSTTL